MAASGRLDFPGLRRQRLGGRPEWPDGIARGAAAMIVAAWAGRRLPQPG